MSRRGLASILLVASAVTLSGCGYRLAGSGRGTLPESAVTISVPTFTNETIRVGLEQRVTDAVLRELSARTKLKAATRGETGDVELTGRLLNYSVVAVRFDADGRALEYEISMTASVKLVDRKAEKVIFENPFFLYREPYNVPPATNYSDVEASAIDNMARPFARGLVTTILEGF